MTTRTLIARLARYLTIDFPDELTTTIVSCFNNHLTLDTNLGATDQYVGGIVEVQDGNAQYTKIPIVGNVGSTLYLANKFDGQQSPQAGDTVILKGGPLAEAVIEQFDDDAIASNDYPGKKFFISIACSDQLMYQKTLGRDERYKGMVNTRRDFEFLLVCETPDVSGGDELEAYEAKTAMDTLVEQVLARVHYFRISPDLQSSENGVIRVKTGYWERDGGAPTSKIAGINFSVGLRR
jgi:hypothetical protein